MTGPIGPTSLSRADSRVSSAHPCGFPPDVPGSDVSLTSSCARTPPAAGHSPVRPFEPGVPVPATRVCAAWVLCVDQRSWDSTLRSFSPAGQFRERFPPRGPTCRFPVASSSMVLVEASAAGTVAELKHGRSGCVRFDFKALTRPASRPTSASSRQGTHAALGFASFGLAGTGSCRVAGSSPPPLIDRRPFRFRRLSAPGLQRRSPALPEPRWSPDQSRSRRLLFSDSSGRCLAPPAWSLPGAGRASRMRFSTF